jgi:hypothetical protein
MRSILKPPLEARDVERTLDALAARANDWSNYR